MESLICPYSPNCGGCSEWTTPYREQLESKKRDLQNGMRSLFPSLPPIIVHSVGHAHLRDRLDFVIEEGRIGLYSPTSKAILDLPECDLLTPALQSLYQEFRKIRWPIKKGSFRLRVGPQGEKGAWLDFSNLDIKNLLDEKSILQNLSEFAFVEIGQRRKSLKLGERFGLADPILKSWAQSSYLGKKVPLYSTVGSFSQAGHSANHKITEVIAKLAKGTSAQRILEYGAGNGNLTFPSMNESSHTHILETDMLAIDGLKKTATELKIQDRIAVLSPRQEIDFASYDLILANPPRSGIPEFLQKMQGELPANFIYMSCFPESFFKDSAQMKKLNYKVDELEIVDQFPQSKHYEVISRWTR